MTHRPQGNIAMSNIENLGIYADFSRDAEAFIKNIQDVAVDDAARRLHVEGAVAGAVAVAALGVAGYKVYVYAADQYKSKAEERKAITAAATEKLKDLFKKAQKAEAETAEDTEIAEAGASPDEAGEDASDTDGRGDEN